MDALNATEPHTLKNQPLSHMSDSKTVVTTEAQSEPTGTRPGPSSPHRPTGFGNRPESAARPCSPLPDSRHGHRSHLLGVALVVVLRLVRRLLSPGLLTLFLSGSDDGICSGLFLRGAGWGDSGGRPGPGVLHPHTPTLPPWSAARRVASGQ